MQQQDTEQLAVEYDDEPIIVSVHLVESAGESGPLCKSEPADDDTQVSYHCSRLVVTSNTKHMNVTLSNSNFLPLIPLALLRLWNFAMQALATISKFLGS
jgi:hypothetical protein